jgi:hypothetical protein
MLDMATGLAAAKTSVELLRTLREVLKKDVVDPHEVSNRLMELQGLLLDARTSLADAFEEINSLRSQVSELMRMAEIGKELEASHGVYFRAGYPYCPVCWDVDRKPVRLSGPLRQERASSGDHWICPFHKQPLSLPWNICGKMQEAQASSAKKPA